MFVGTSTVNTNITASRILLNGGTFLANATTVNTGIVIVSGNATINAIIANGSIGTANQVLLSNGAGIYWSNSATVAAGAQIYTSLNFGGF
jgi:hypothetical protein